MTACFSWVSQNGQEKNALGESPRYESFGGLMGTRILPSRAGGVTLDPLWQHRSKEILYSFT